MFFTSRVKVSIPKILSIIARNRQWKLLMLKKRGTHAFIVVYLCWWGCWSDVCFNYNVSSQQKATFHRFIGGQRFISDFDNI